MLNFTLWGAAFSCFADLALVSPQDYRLEGQGSLLQCVLAPADGFMPMHNEDIAALTHQQVSSCCAQQAFRARARCEFQRKDWTSHA